jgi:hypothetical protein
MLPVVLYGFETWSVTLREEHRLRVFKGWVQREIFGSTRNEVTRNWRRLYKSIFMIFSPQQTLSE